MSESHRSVCAACGAGGELHRHHLVPRVHRTACGLTVMLCLACHGAVHGVEWPTNLAALSKAGKERARAEGRPPDAPRRRGTGRSSTPPGGVRTRKPPRSL